MKLCPGDALVRNPASLIDVSKKFVNSSAHSILTTGAQAGEQMYIKNPDFQGGSGESNLISGAEAYLKVVSGTMAGTSYSGLQRTNPLIDFLEARQAGKWGGETIAGYVQSAGGPLISHGDVSYTFNPQAPSLGGRMVALDSELSEEERAFYIERGTLLHETIKDLSLVDGFRIDFPDTWVNQRLVSTRSYYPDVKQDYRIVSNDLISAPVQKAYICTSLIELLLALVDKIGIRGGFGTERALVTNTKDNDAGINLGTAQAEEGKGMVITDHAFGRAFDIQAIGTSQDSLEEISTQSLKYETQLDIFLEALSTIPMPLLPDLIVMHPEVANKLGVVEGLESPEAAIKIKYPQLKYVNFYSDANHTDHIHVSFSGDRAGKYIGSDGLIVSVSSTSTTSDLTGDALQNQQSAIEVSKKNFKNDSETKVSLLELFYMLTEKFFTDEAAAIFCAIAARESSGGGSVGPGSFNGKCSITEKGGWGGDYSVGMFQFNLISLMNKPNNSSKDIKIVYDGTKVLDKPMALRASHASYTPRKRSRMG